MTPTLADYGVINLDFLVPPAALPPNEILFESLDWGELNAYLEQNKRTHPTDRLWITNDRITGRHQIRREK